MRVCPHDQCLLRCMEISESRDKNRLPGDTSPAGALCSGPRIGQESHSSTSYHPLHSLFPKASATSELNFACSRPVACSQMHRDAHMSFDSAHWQIAVLVQAIFLFLAEGPEWSRLLSQ